MDRHPIVTPKIPPSAVLQAVVRHCYPGRVAAVGVYRAAQAPHGAVRWTTVMTLETALGLQMERVLCTVVVSPNARHPLAITIDS